MDERSGLPYGIIDPDYARIFTIARTIAWQKGYALMMHGSFTRDLDLLAVPWSEKAHDPEHLIAQIMDATGCRSNGHAPSEKPHGRMVWTLLLSTGADPRFVDIGIIPRALLREAPAGWRPIETAPKHYTPLLLRQDETVGEGWHASHIRLWEFANSSHVMRRHPTHWMPLPAAPKDGA